MGKVKPRSQSVEDVTEQLLDFMEEAELVLSLDDKDKLVAHLNKWLSPTLLCSGEWEPLPCAESKTREFLWDARRRQREKLSDMSKRSSAHAKVWAMINETPPPGLGVLEHTIWAAINGDEQKEEEFYQLMRVAESDPEFRSFLQILLQ